MIPPRLRSSEPSGLDRFFWSNNASPDIRYLRHFFPQKICESLPAHRICFVFHLMSHTPWQNLSCFTHFRSYDIFVSPFHPTADFSWLIALIPTYHLVAPVYIMASQDLISQFSPDLNAIPPSQPDRSRTPPRPQHGWHQTVPMFRGPMHFAMTIDPSTVFESCWHTASTTDIYMVLSTPNMDSAHITFPTYTAYVLPTTSQQRQFCTSATSSHTEIAKTYVISRRKLCYQ